MQKLESMQRMLNKAAAQSPHIKRRELLEHLAQKHGVPMMQAAFEACEPALLTKHDHPKIDMGSLFEEMGYTTCKIVPNDNGGGFVSAVCDTVKFPKNTAYLHFMAVIAAAMNPRFSYQVYGNSKSPVTIYAIGSQPPSTGKSGIHSYFTAPILREYEIVNAKIKEESRAIAVSIKEKALQLKTASGREAATIEQWIEDLEEKRSVMAPPVFMTDDATPEGLQQLAGSQGCWFNILSPEADILNIMFGSSYGEGKKANHQLILKSWDGEYYSGARVTRSMKNGNYRGCVGVLAQDEGIKAILSAGESGRGLSERVLLMRERPLLGSRDHTTYTPINQDWLSWYDGLIANLVHAGETLFTFTPNAINMVNEKRNDYERFMGGNGKYSSALLQGVLGKSGAQTFRIASVLHVTRHWSAGGSKSTMIDDQTVIDAINIYDQLKDSFIQVAEGQGYAGEKSLQKAAVECLLELVEKRKTKIGRGYHHISLSAFRDIKRNRKPFSGHSQLTTLLRDNVFPELVSAGVCAFVEDEIFINPNLLS
jgi:hypothetical protein